MRALVIVIVVAVVGVVVGCAACTPPQPSVFDAGSEGEGEGEGEGERVFACGDSKVGVVFSTLCTQDEGCTVVRVQLDCCGSVQLTGVAPGAAGAAQNDADTCAATFPACECAAQPDVADDGSHPAGSVTTPAAVCANGSCSTTFIID